MSGRGLFNSSAKTLPPEHGIKTTKAGVTWWGKKWLNSLEALGSGDSSRLARGRTYARDARVAELVVMRGHVSAKVAGTHREPYSVKIQVVPLDDAQWRNVITCMATKAQYAAELLAGRMPNQVEDVLRIIEQNLFVQRRSDIVSMCSCPDWMELCKHVAATQIVLADAIDNDPFLLFELRGRTKSELLAALRFERTASEATSEQSRPWMEEEIESVKLESFVGQDWDAWRCDRRRVRFSFENPSRSANAIGQLGNLEPWPEELPPAEAFATQINAAAEFARKLAIVHECTAWEEEA